MNYSNGLRLNYINETTAVCIARLFECDFIY